MMDEQIIRTLIRQRILEVIALNTPVADTSNTAAFIRAAFIGLGVSAENIKSIHHAPGGFSANPRRWCITLHHSVSLSALQVNWIPGLSLAIWNGNVCWVIVGKE